MSAESGASQLVSVVALLGAAVVTVPIFRRLGLGSVLGYLAAGLAIGPFGLKWFNDPQSILHVAELGVVMFLFVIGLEMRPSHLWSLRGEIFGLGAAQVLLCCALLSGVAMLGGLPPAAAVIGASGFVLSSTAVIMQMLDERGETATEAGQRAVSILLLEDLAVVPLLALVVVLGTMSGGAVEGGRPVWLGLLIGLGCIAVVIAAGRWLLNPFFQILARTGAREIMTAAALLVVLGTALFMQWAASPWRWARSSPGCCSRNRPSASSLRPTSSRSAASCWVCSSSASACRWTCRWWPPNGRWSCSACWPSWR